MKAEYLRGQLSDSYQRGRNSVGVIAGVLLLCLVIGAGMLLSACGGDDDEDVRPTATLSPEEIARATFAAISTQTQVGMEATYQQSTVQAELTRLAEEAQQTAAANQTATWTPAPSPMPASPSISVENAAQVVELQRLGRGAISDAVISPDGNTLAVASSIEIWLYDMTTWEPIHLLEGHTGYVYSVDFSPDGRTLASTSYDRTVRLWDVQSGTLLHTLEHTNRLRGVDFSLDGRTLASASGETVRLWDVQSGTLLDTLESDIEGVYSVSFSPDGHTLAFGACGATDATQQCVGGEITLRDVQTGTMLRILEGHEADVRSVSFSPDGQTLASGACGTERIGFGCVGGEIILWDVQTGAMLRTLEGHAGWVSSVSFSPDGRMLASGACDTVDSEGSCRWDEVILWDVQTGTLLHTLEGHRDVVRSVSFSPDGRTLASGASEAVRLWDVQSGTLLHTLEGRMFNMSYLMRFSMSFSPDGRTLAFGSESEAVQLWDVQSGELLRTLAGHVLYVLSVSYSPDGRTLASGSSDNSVRLWDAQSGALLHTLEGHTDAVGMVSFSPDGRTLASASSDDTIRLWDAQTGVLLRTLAGHEGGVWSVSFSPDGQTLASGASDDTIRLWDAQTGALLHTLEGHTGWVQSVSFSPDGRILASGSDDGTARLWNVQTGELLYTLEHTDPGFNRVLSVSFSSDGRLLASSLWLDDVVWLWDVQTGALLRTLEGHMDYVNSVNFSSDGTLLASGSWDGTIRIWGVPGD